MASLKIRHHANLGVVAQRFARALRLVLPLSGLLILSVGQAQTTRPVTVQDMIEMTKWADPDYWLGATWYDPNRGGRAAQVSPDGTKFAAVFRKGNVTNNTNEFSLLVWDTSDLFHYPMPRETLKLTSSSNREAITDLAWLPDSETLAFLGEDPGELRQLHIYNIRTQDVRKLTNSPTNLVSYGIGGHGQVIAYVAEEPTRAVWDEEAIQRGFVVSNEWPADLIASRRGGQTVGGGTNELFVQIGANQAFPVALPLMISPGSSPQLSPDDRYVLISVIAKTPEEWKEYVEPRLRAIVHGDALPYMSTLQELAVVDTATGNSRVLLRAPAASTKAVWAPNSQSVVLESTFLPLERTEGNERKSRQRTPFTAEVNIFTGSIAKITEQKLKLVRWEATTKQLILESAEEGSAQDNLNRARTVYFEKGEGGWRETKEGTAPQDRPEIVLQEDMNTPPEILAVDPKTNRSVLLLDLNPQFKNLQFGKVQEITWQTPDGHAIKGGLYFPVNYVAGRRYPLVIQTHQWLANKFWIDGPWTTAYAAQALAGKDIMVLQAERAVDIDRWRRLHVTSNEAPMQVGIYDGAIDYLDRRGLIDTGKVGILGFSRTCYYVKYALAHASHHFAAASVTDGIDVGYSQYILSSTASSEFASEFAAINGGLPWGKSLRTWVQRSPTFMIDKVHTPLHITALDSGMSLLSEWEWFSALRSLRKPVELQVIGGTRGVHILERPWDRLASQGGTVDWFCFWLKGEEDPDPAKAEQYERWRELRKLQQESENHVPIVPAN
jgi:dipeptidyl aminopeptidase/acylaminoacyl peptidase